MPANFIQILQNLDHQDPQDQKREGVSIEQNNVFASLSYIPGHKHGVASLEQTLSNAREILKIVAAPAPKDYGRLTLPKAVNIEVKS